MNRTPNFTLEPTAAGPSVCERAGGFAAPSRYRGSVSGGCGSAIRWAPFAHINL
jgi:hypothetical protein